MLQRGWKVVTYRTSGRQTTRVMTISWDTQVLTTRVTAWITRVLQRLTVMTRPSPCCAWSLKSGCRCQSRCSESLGTLSPSSCCVITDDSRNCRQLSSSCRGSPSSIPSYSSPFYYWGYISCSVCLMHDPPHDQLRWAICFSGSPSLCFTLFCWHSFFVVAQLAE